MSLINIAQWVQAILDTQDVDPDSDHYGAFYNASDTDNDGSPVQAFYHDCKVNYIAMNLRGMVESLFVLPAGTMKDNVRTAVKLCANHVINTRFAPDNTLKTNYKTTGGSDPNASNDGTQALELMLAAFCRLLVAAETDGGFLDVEKERILKTMHRLANGLPRASRYSLAGLGCYRTTVDWWNAGATGTDILLEMP